VWTDEAEMMVGDSLIDKLRSAIEEYEYLGVVISRSSIQSEWVKREVDVALNQEFDGKRVKVLPIILDDAPLPGFIRGKVFADFRDPARYTKALTDLLVRLGRTRPLEVEPELVVVHSGEFTMGSDPERDRDAQSDEQPQHLIFLPTFAVSKHLISVSQYAEFCCRSGHNGPNRFIGELTSIPGPFATNQWSGSPGTTLYATASGSLANLENNITSLRKPNGKRRRAPLTAVFILGVTNGISVVAMLKYSLLDSTGNMDILAQLVMSIPTGMALVRTALCTW
jgi:hypothetical protein